MSAGGLSLRGVGKATSVTRAVGAATQGWAPSASTSCAGCCATSRSTSRRVNRWASSVQRRGQEHASDRDGTTMPTTGTVETGKRVGAPRAGHRFHPTSPAARTSTWAEASAPVPETDRALMAEIVLLEIDYLDQPVHLLSGSRCASRSASPWCVPTSSSRRGVGRRHLLPAAPAHPRLPRRRRRCSSWPLVATVYSPCSRALYIEDGVPQLDGPAKEG